MVREDYWVASKSKERQSQNFIKTALGLVGYKVMDYGIENHCQDIIKEIKGTYKNETNNRILSMPDYVVIDPDTKNAELVEVKYRSAKKFDWEKDGFLFGFTKIKKYVQYWTDATLVIIMETEPYCTCVRVCDIELNKDYVRKIQTGADSWDEIWKFSGKYHKLNDIFPRISDEKFMRALHLSGIKSNEKK